jgi:hypothetical protein
MRMIPKLLLVFSLASLITACPAQETPVTTRTINGKLLNGMAQPITAASLSGATLRVYLLGSTVNAAIDANGNFTLADVPASYSLLVLISKPNEVNQYATVFAGLTRANPTLTIQGIGISPTVKSSFASVRGTVTGGLGFNAASSASTILTLALPKAISLSTTNYTSVDPAIGEYGASASWSGGDPTTGTLHALQYTTNAAGKITAYGGYAQKTITLTNQSNVSGPDPGPLPVPTAIKQDLVLEAVGSGNVNGAITWPTDVAQPNKKAYTALLLGGTNPTSLDLYPVFGTQPVGVGGATYDQNVPLIAGAQFVQHASIKDGSGGSAFGSAAESTIWKMVTPGSKTDIVVLAPIGLILPAAAASNVTESTSFSWSTYPGVHILSIYPFLTGPPAPGTNPVVLDIITAGSSATIPDLSPYNLGLPKATIHFWRVMGVSTYSSVDAATDSSGLIVPYYPPTSDVGFSTSAGRVFTTAP